MEKPKSYCEFVQTLDKNNVHRIYHDTAYGFSIDDDNELFERLVLEINQAGLSWKTILNKQENFKKAYNQFNTKKIAAYKEMIGYLPESNPLYYDMYVKEYLSFIAGVHQISNKVETIKNTIDLVGLEIEQNKKIGQLSKGYKQRVGLAAALLHQPEVLILDEPTSGLDPNQIIEIRNVIKEQGKNKTVLFSSHILQEVQAICDRVIIINKGEIVADDLLINLQSGGKSLENIFRELTLSEA